MSEKVYFYVNTPLDEGEERKFFLHEIQGEEQISGLFHYRLRLKTSDNNIDFSTMIGEGVTATIELHSGGKRYINGVVSSFTQAESDEEFTTYYAEIRPWLWQLTLTSDSRIYQNQSVIEIIDALFSDLGFTDFDDWTTGSYAKREYCVQYQETAFDFISRLMEEEGIFYFFEHSQDTHTLVLADDNGSCNPCPDISVAHFREVSAEWEVEDMIDRCILEQQMIPNEYAVEDFNFETPDTDLLTTVPGKETGSLRIYEYPGGFTKTADGETVAKKRLEAHELPQKMLIGDGFCRSFIAGFTFALEDHDREDMNATYVLRFLSITATQERYTNTFEAFPVDAPFRPPLTTKKPRLFGTQTAVVVGKSGEEIWTDKYGRVKVQFHWDQKGTKDENSSCWVRVAQVWAGKGWGTLFIPRIGTEVVVNFIDGNPDKPIIIGTVYNANQTVPYSLTGEQNLSTILTRSTKQGEAGNEVRFNDTKDAEELFIHAQKDMNVVVENDETISIKQNRTAEILEANDELTVEKGDRIIKVNTGNETHEVKGERSLTITKDETHTNEAAFTQEVTKDFTLTVNGNLTIDVKGDVTIKSANSLTAQAGLSLTNKAGTDLTNQAGTSLTNKAGTDLTNQAGTSLTNKANISITNEANVSLTNKASASQTVDGGGFLNVKGGMVKIN
jgi:type VI secretion system secreted protein VgrG